MNNGMLIVISGPSGVGKGTICKELLQRNPKLALSVSTTTRTPRAGDVDGVTYHFRTAEAFEAQIENGDFLEWAVYNQNYYGTGIRPVMEQLAAGRDVLLEIDVQGALKVKKSFPSRGEPSSAVYIFIVPPDEGALAERLHKRGTDSTEDIERRIAESQRELELQEHYDYIVVNDDLDEAIAEVEKIIEEAKGH